MPRTTPKTNELAAYIKPHMFWDGGCKRICELLYGPCLVSVDKVKFKNTHHCIPDYFSDGAGIIEMKYSMGALRSCTEQMGKFKKITNRITYWVYHDSPNRKFYERLYGVTILAYEDIRKKVLETKNAQAIGILETLFQNEGTIRKNDFWTKSAIDICFDTKVLPLLPGDVIPGNKAFFTKNKLLDWHAALNSLKKGYCGLEDFAKKRGYGIGGFTNRPSDYIDTDDGKFILALKFKSSKDQWDVISKIQTEMLSVQKEFGLGNGLLYANRKQWNFGPGSTGVKNIGVNYYCFFPLDFLSCEELLRIYATFVGNRLIDDTFLDKAIYLAKNGIPLSLDSALSYSPKHAWYVSCINSGRSRISADPKITEFFNVFAIQADFLLRPGLATGNEWNLKVEREIAANFPLEI